jgi:transcriptional regulator with XRE-family HTH domain
MNELSSRLREDFKDPEFRNIYANESLNTWIATQIKVLRESRGMTQSELAEAAGMRQSAVSRLEDVDYSNWTLKTLRRLAEAMDVRLSVKFETFSSLIHEIESLSRDNLDRPTFNNDVGMKRLETKSMSAQTPISVAINAGCSHVASTGLASVTNIANYRAALLAGRHTPSTLLGRIPSISYAETYQTEFCK